MSTSLEILQSLWDRFDGLMGFFKSTFLPLASRMCSGSLRPPHRCQICASDISQDVWGVNRVLHTHLHTLGRGVEGCDAGVWSSTVNHRSDFAYLGDAVTSVNIATLCISLSSPLRLPHTYQLLRSVLILSLPWLYLAVHTEPKPACPRSINGISLLVRLSFHMSSCAFLRLHLSGGRLKFCTSQFGPFEIFRNGRRILIFHGTSELDGH